MQIEKLLKLKPAELVDLGICPTCLDRLHQGAIYGDTKDTLFYQDMDIECFYVKEPRADGHMCIASKVHYHDMSEAPDSLNEKIIRFSKQLMIILKEVYQCERTYLCTMCDGPMNHYHIQLIPRYKNEIRGSSNFVKERKQYVYNEKKFEQVKEMIQKYASEFLA